MDDYEGKAWRWLLAIERLDWQTHSVRKTDRQIMVWATPGTLGASGGAPLIHVSVAYPGIDERISGSGNSLHQACERLHQKFWTLGVQLPFIFQIT